MQGRATPTHTAFDPIHFTKQTVQHDRFPEQEINFSPFWDTNSFVGISGFLDSALFKLLLFLYLSFINVVLSQVCNKAFSNEQKPT